MRMVCCWVECSLGAVLVGKVPLECDARKKQRKKGKYLLNLQIRWDHIQWIVLLDILACERCISHSIASFLLLQLADAFRVNSAQSYRR